MDATEITNQRQRKTSKGRQKIEIKKLENVNRRYVTFSKRKHGIFKKATELSTLCGAEIAVVLFSGHGKVFSCGNPDVDEVIDRYLAETEGDGGNSCLVESSSSSSSTAVQTVDEQEYNKSLARLEEMKRAVQMNSNVINNGEFWWDLPIEMMGKEELEGYKESLVKLRKNVLSKIEEMAANNAANESRIISQFIHQNGAWSGEIFNSNIYGGGLL
ncbi:mads box protein, putative [Ricinus communis]|uniref:Mads box protein, putative n=1 Tax=Ricinus communis TaxID=3988 RepID=B9T6Y7_RICCO|nr:mads box protein, putative [Ricinus communis]